MFKVGETVVHPHHGIGTITGLVEREFESGGSRKYYEISMTDGTLWVPVDQPDLGLRHLTSKSELARCGKVLQGSPSVTDLDPRHLHDELAKHLRAGTIIAQCEVVRDVSALGWKKPLAGAMAELRRVALNVLCQEWAAVAGVPLAEATNDINAYLDTGKHAFYG